MSDSAPPRALDSAPLRAADSNADALGSVHHYRQLIIESHLDTFGHVNNATYLQLFEEARWSLITERGYGIPHIQATRRGPVILDVEMRFRREVKNREQVVIETQLLSYKGKISRLRQTMKKSDGASACEALFTMALWDLDERKLILPTEDWLAAIGVAGPLD